MPNKYIPSQDRENEFFSVDDDTAEAFASAGTPVLTEDDPAVQAWLIASARSSATRRTVAFANTMRERIAASKHYLQAARWPIQLAAAQAIKAGGGTQFDIDIMAREARLRNLGETVEQLADKVLANSFVFASVGAAVDGIERATLDSIAACAEVARFEPILTAAKATALAEFLDIFGAVYSPEQAQAMAVPFFGPVEGEL